MTSVKPDGRTAGAAWMPHLAAAGSLLAVLLLGLTATLLLLARAAADPVRTGRLTALFPPGWGAEERLEAAEAALVLPALPSDLLALGGCSDGSLADYPDRPALRKLRAGPM